MPKKNRFSRLPAPPALAKRMKGSGRQEKRYALQQDDSIDDLYYEEYEDYEEDMKYEENNSEEKTYGDDEEYDHYKEYEEYEKDQAYNEYEEHEEYDSEYEEHTKNTYDLEEEDSDDNNLLWLLEGTDTSDNTEEGNRHNDEFPSLPNKPQSDATPTYGANPFVIPPFDDNVVPAQQSVSRASDTGCVEELQAMKNLLDETKAELQVAEGYATRLEEEKEALARYLIGKVLHLEEQNEGQAADLGAQKDVIRDLKVQLNEAREQITTLQEDSKERGEEIVAQAETVEILKADAVKSQSDLTILTEEKLNWQAKLDEMHDRLHLAEKKLRSLDHVTRIKVDARLSGRLANITRSLLWFARTGSETEIQDQVTDLNAWIRSTALLFARDLVCSEGLSDAAQCSRAAEILGESMSGLVQLRAGKGLLEGDGIVLRTLVEMFLVHWATKIIEAWYPEQKCFADILAELAAQQHTGRHHASHIRCGEPLNIMRTTSSATDFARWANVILRDFKDVVHAVGVAMDNDTSGPDPFLREFVTLLEKAWAVRQSLAERDLCRGMELAVVVPETLFQAKLMENLYAAPGSGGRAATAALINAERVAGTCRLGLQIPATTTQGPVLVLKPKVVLLSMLRDSQ